MGYGPAPREEVEPEPKQAPTFGDDDIPFVKYSPDQARVSAGNSEQYDWYQ